MRGERQPRVKVDTEVFYLGRVCDDYVCAVDFPCGRGDPPVEERPVGLFIVDRLFPGAGVFDKVFNDLRE